MLIRFDIDNLTAENHLEAYKILDPKNVRDRAALLVERCGLEAAIQNKSKLADDTIYAIEEDIDLLIRRLVRFGTHPDALTGLYGIQAIVNANAPVALSDLAEVAAKLYDIDCRSDGPVARISEKALYDAAKMFAYDIRFLTHAYQIETALRDIATDTNQQS